ncbi:hypothetical protein M8Z33_32980 [Streptomyces sp. ZAF1911]|uniref:hypothetical protein n=1 Tax=unclassified Streptomyces TaxID=2593676 RepID=UPI00237BCAA9|nr:hypothetical protein [Streptomyces sp. ZAF1911]MDD9381381.1 hypothetical protein [Streptomyces sp. ZAF1911]
MPVVEATDVVDYIAEWAAFEADRAAGAGPADATPDQALDAGVHRVQEIVRAKLGGDTAFARAVEEGAARNGELTKRTRTRLQLALEEALEDPSDPGFAEALAEAIARIHAAGPHAYAAFTGKATAEEGGEAITGVEISHEDLPGARATAHDTGDAHATGQGSSANSGVRIKGRR